MSTTQQLLWILSQERQQQAREAARERLGRAGADSRGGSVGRLAVWIRDRVRVRRNVAYGGREARAAR